MSTTTNGGFRDEKGENKHDKLESRNRLHSNVVLTFSDPCVLMHAVLNGLVIA